MAEELLKQEDFEIVKKAMKIENINFLDQLKKENSLYDDYLHNFDKICGIQTFPIEFDVEINSFVDLCHILKITKPNNKSEVLKAAATFAQEVEESNKIDKRLQDYHESFVSLFDDLRNLDEIFYRHELQGNEDVENLKEKLQCDIGRNNGYAYKYNKKYHTKTEELKLLGFEEDFSLKKFDELTEEIAALDERFDDLMIQIDSYCGLPTDLEDARLVLREKEEYLKDVELRMVRSSNLATWN